MQETQNPKELGELLVPGSKTVLRIQVRVGDRHLRAIIVAEQTMQLHSGRKKGNGIGRVVTQTCGEKSAPSNPPGSTTTQHTYVARVNKAYVSKNAMLNFYGDSGAESHIISGEMFLQYEDRTREVCPTSAAVQFGASTQ
jgi:hypothetical protein